jgi:hypothetical protein
VSTIGRLERVELRELWKHEERGFSKWLENNLDELSEAIGIMLSEPKREERAGNFQVDLVAESADGNIAVIENQLEFTNHDHLGKILTYLTNLDAKIAVWIAKEARAEHIRTIQWLNETTPQDIAFFLVRLAAYKIGNSDPAPLFTVIVGPSSESKVIGEKKKELAERHVLRQRFWTQLLAKARDRKVMTHSSRSPSKDNWIAAGAGVRAGISFNYVIWMDEKAAVELYIDTDSKEDNKRIFNVLHNEQEKIEEAFGNALIWERLDDKKASRIRYSIQEGGLADGEEEWPIIQDAMISAMDRLSKALKPHFQNL